jgi:hypothetical protein
MKRTVSLSLALALAFASCDESADMKVEREANTVAMLAVEASLVAAVKVQNAQNLTVAQIIALDQAWVAGTAPALVQAVTTGACADKLRVMLTANDAYAEMFLMDNKGALVCAAAKPTDYYQGDEDKWTKSYNGGAGRIYIAPPAFDASANATLVQISAPVKDGTTTVGVMMVGVDTDKLD